MRNIIHQYKLRLTNLSQSNRSLKLSTLSTRRDLDLMDAAFADELSANEILSKIVAGKDVVLLKNLSSRDEKANLLDLKLNKIHREVNTVFEESGAYDLFLGYPWVEGKFLEGNIARCPVMLFPVKLIRDYRKSPRWKLEVSDDEDILFNKTFFLAYEKFQRSRLGQEFWDEQPDRFTDLQGFLNYLYNFLTKQEVQLNFNQELFEFKLRSFPNVNSDILDNLPTGKLKFQPYAVLGIFPQSDSSLIQDYDKLELDPKGYGVGTLLRPDWENGPEQTKSTPPETRRHFVTPVDESQENVLLRVREGKSVVVHGPPGTGKSQVILNLVADAMAEGKRVLVCSQKRAALDVVYQRLAEIGLAQFAALIHDYRADRARLFEKIRRQIDEIPVFQKERINGALARWEYDFMVDARQIDEYNRFFDELKEALTRQRSHGLRTHDLYLMCAPGLPKYGLGNLTNSLDWDGLRRFSQKLKEILAYPEFFSPENAWFNRIPFHTLGLERRKRISQDLSQLPEVLSQLHHAQGAFFAVTGNIENPDEVREKLVPYQTLRKRLSEKSHRKAYNSFTKEKTENKKIVSILDKADRLIQKRAKFKILDDFPGRLLPDLFEHFAVYVEKMDQFFRLFDFSYLKARWYVHEILEKRKLSPTNETIKAMALEVETLQKMLKIAEEMDKIDFLADFQPTETPENLSHWLENKRHAVETGKLVKSIKHYTDWLPTEGKSGFSEKHWEKNLTQMDACEAYLSKIQQIKQHWNAWLHPDQQAQLIQLIPDPILFQSFTAKLSQSFEKDFEDIRNLDELIAQLLPAEKNIFLKIRPFISIQNDGQQFSIQSLQNDFLLSWIEKDETETPNLKEVSARRINNRMEDYQAKVGDRQKKVAGLVDRKMKDKIVDSIEYNRVNNPVTYRGIHHQVVKKRLVWPVRKLVSEFWEESLATLIPCWLASPESVAAVFPMEKDYFDLVIFDEASQCFVERALPVLLRGKSAVVAGDEKQLPPFDLYSVKAEEDESAFLEDEIALEVKSILDLARTSFTDCHLSWHYRSQEEELINFSNYAFYDGRLNIMPPVEIDPYFRPIVWVGVEGIWESNRNVIEAKEVINLVEKLVVENPSQTIGIVTFNFHQQETIRDLFEIRLSELMASGDEKVLPALLSAMEKGEGEERQGIFIKNIENVQGDERDIIIFSVGYAPDKNGKLVSHFGLLNQDGGENRLNVAITRARKQVFVCCSFQPEKLRVEDSTHPGPKLFKQYLLYAQAVSSQNKENINTLLEKIGGTKSLEVSAQSFPAGIVLADELAQKLLDRGVSIARNIGDTNYKVDIAIRKPNNKNAFLLGIECEGEHYFSGRSPKEREVYRWNLLQKRGWKLHRVWARNYFLDPEKEIDRILALISESENT